MKLKLIALAAAVLVAVALGLLRSPLLSASQKAGTPQVKAAGELDAAGGPQIPKDKKSYAIGVQVAKDLQQEGIDFDVDTLLQGFHDQLSGKKLRMSDDDVRVIMTELQSEVIRKHKNERAVSAADNQKEGAAFLAANRSKPGVIALPSGLQYRVLKAGTGKKPTDADEVVVQYRGTLIDGKEFDSSYRRGEPATLKVASVIPGWREALKRMPAGSKWELVIPARLAYGPRGVGQEIPPNATLLFAVELLEVK